MADTSPTVRRRRLAAELRRLRGDRTGAEVADGLGWSTAKISRYELGQGGFPPKEVRRLLEYYEVAEPRRTQLMALAADANARGWWEDYADVTDAGYREFIGLEAEAASVLQWQVETIPGLLQTRDYAQSLNDAVRAFSFTPPGIVERRTELRMTRQRVLTERDPRLNLKVTVDESALLREIGGPSLMRAQLGHMAELAQLSNVELRILPLRRPNPLMAASFVVFDFSPVAGVRSFGDVVSFEMVGGEALTIEGESDTYQYRLLFEALSGAALSPEDSVAIVKRVADEVWLA